MVRSSVWSGWINLAGLLMVIVGAIDSIQGLIAIIRGKYFALTPNQIIIFDVKTWGWITLIWGIVLVLAGFALWSGSSFARWFTIVVVALNIIAQLGWLGSSGYPLWSLVIITLNIIVLYALTARWEGYPDRSTV